MILIYFSFLKYFFKILSNFPWDLFDACIEVGKEINSGESEDKINGESMKILLYSKFISYDNAKYIIESNKLSFSGSDNLLNNYK